MRTLAHDGYARTETVRRTETGRTVDVPGGFGDQLYACDWCGTVRRTASGKPQAYRYGTHSDGFGARVNWETRVFCCKSCRDAFSR